MKELGRKLTPREIRRLKKYSMIPQDALQNKQIAKKYQAYAYGSSVENFFRFSGDERTAEGIYSSIHLIS